MNGPGNESRALVHGRSPSRYLWRGVIVSAVGLLAVVIVSLTSSVRSYRGECGGLLPWLAGPRPCSLLDYLRSDLLFLTLLGWLYWPLVLAWCLLGPLVGYMLDRRSRHHRD